MTIKNGRKKGCGACGMSEYGDDTNLFTGILPWNGFVSTLLNEVPGTRNDISFLERRNCKAKKERAQQPI